MDGLDNRDEQEGSSSLSEVTCPTCFENFSVAVLPAAECPAELDYDCEVCCRPMVLRYSDDGYPVALGMED